MDQPKPSFTCPYRSGGDNRKLKIENRKCKGAQPGNLNALRHGLYSAQFKAAELKAVDKAAGGTPSASEEIAAARLILKRFIDRVAGEEMDLETHMRATWVIVQSAARLCRMLALEQSLLRNAPSDEPSVKEIMSAALEAALAEIDAQNASPGSSTFNPYPPISPASSASHPLPSSPGNQSSPLSAGPLPAQSAIPDQPVRTGGSGRSAIPSGPFPSSDPSHFEPEESFRLSPHPNERGVFPYPSAVAPSDPTPRFIAPEDPQPCQDPHPAPFPSSISNPESAIPTASPSEACRRSDLGSSQMENWKLEMENSPIRFHSFPPETNPQSPPRLSPTLPVLRSPFTVLSLPIRNPQSSIPSPLTFPRPKGGEAS